MNAIVVVDQKWGIGKNNNLLFRLPLDLSVNFKGKTQGKVVVMGANTYYSLPDNNKPLANRTNIVLDSSGTQHSGTITVASLPQLLELLKQYDDDEIFVIGGAMVYSLMLPYCHRVYVTKVDSDGGATVFFENLDNNKDWQIEEKSDIIVDNNYHTTYNTYVRK